MAARKHAPSGGFILRKRASLRIDRPNRGAALKAGPIDIDALFEDTMRRFPETMARLAE